MEALKEWEGKFAHVDIPHDWLIYDTLHLYETATGWYRKRFPLTAGTDSGVFSGLTACIWIRASM